MRASAVLKSAGIALAAHRNLGHVLYSLDRSEEAAVAYSRRPKPNTCLRHSPGPSYPAPVVLPLSL